MTRVDWLSMRASVFLSGARTPPQWLKKNDPRHVTQSHILSSHCRFFFSIVGVFFFRSVFFPVVRLFFSIVGAGLSLLDVSAVPVSGEGPTHRTADHTPAPVSEVTLPDRAVSSAPALMKEKCIDPALAVIVALAPGVEYITSQHPTPVVEFFTPAVFTAPAPVEKYIAAALSVRSTCASGSVCCTSSSKDRSICARGGVHCTSPCNPVHRGSACRAIRVTSSCCGLCASASVQRVRACRVKHVAPAPAVYRRTSANGRDSESLTHTSSEEAQKGFVLG